MKRRAPTDPLDLFELKRLYRDEGLTLRVIAAKYDVTFQAVHDRLVRAGVKLRRHPNKRNPIGKRALEKLHLEQRLSIEEMAQQLGTSVNHVDKSMKRHLIPRLTIAKRSQLARLKIGETLQLPKSKRKRYYSNIYGVAKHAGVRVSIGTIDQHRIEVRRVA